MKSPTDVVSGFILLGLCGVGAYSVATLPEAGGMEHVGPGAFPAGILVLLTALSLVLIVQGFRRSPVKVYWPESKVFQEDPRLHRLVLPISGYPDWTRRALLEYGKPALSG